MKLNPIWFEIAIWQTEWTEKGPVTKKITLYENSFLVF